MVRSHQTWIFHAMRLHTKSMQERVGCEILVSCFSCSVWNIWTKAKYSRGKKQLASRSHRERVDIGWLCLLARVNTNGPVAKLAWEMQFENPLRVWCESSVRLLVLVACWLKNITAHLDISYFLNLIRYGYLKLHVHIIGCQLMWFGN